ncbi:hypothetical protein AZF04_05140 [Alkalihalobacillus trypoxylicola]|uniref:Major facilitator superfamily (MFS) profile domain-containing protein n=1 Tax=Alkalihalobacillus trypoxylicola TaxID=519424 RepID=A0A162EFS1_9BACI|nr:hypothetical protein AZF04_05140 [Alkalihalobacillus trypoxylicola]
MSKKELILRRNALFAVFLLPGMTFASWVSRTPEIREILDISTAMMGWIIFGLAFGSIFGLLSANRFILKTGGRFVIISSIIFLSIGLSIISIGILIATSTIVFLGLVLFGVGYGLVEVATNVEGAKLEKIAKKTILPALHASFSAGTLVGAGLGALAIFIQLPIYIHLSFIIVIILTIVWSAYRFIPEGTGKFIITNEKIKTPLKVNLWKEKRTLLICLIVLGMAFAEGSANDWLPLAIVDGFLVEPTIGTAIYAIFLSAMFLGRISGGYFLDKYGRVIVLRILAGLAIIGLTLVILSTNLVFASIGVALWGLGASLGFPVSLSAASDDPRGAVARVGFVSVAGYLAFLVGPPILGIIGEHIGLINAMSIVLVLVIIAGIVSHSAKELKMTD